MPKPVHPSKQKLSGSHAVSECLIYETPPATPPNMKKYRKTHNQVPGIKVIHHGLIDQVLPPSDHVYGIKLNEGSVQSAVPQVTQMFREGHKTELGNYIKQRDEMNYKRYKMGESIQSECNLPEYTKDPEFAFGLKSERSQSGTKELIEIDPNLQIPLTFAQMPLTKAIDAQKEVIQKRNYYYDWNALNIDPKAYVFGKPKKVENEDKDKIDSVSNSLKFIADENEWNKPLNPVKQALMPSDYVYGKVRQNPNKENKEWGVKECVHTEVEEKKCVLQRDRAENKIDFGQFANKICIASRLDPNRVTAKDLLSPSHAATGIYRDEFIRNREMDEIINIYAKAGHSVDQQTSEKIKLILKKNYDNICSLDNFKAALHCL
eukprot:197562_1